MYVYLVKLIIVSYVIFKTQLIFHFKVGDRYINYACIEIFVFFKNVFLIDVFTMHEFKYLFVKCVLFVHGKLWNTMFQVD